jgi:hypothetical protein
MGCHPGFEQPVSLPIFDVEDQPPVWIVKPAVFQIVKEAPVIGIDPAAVDAGYKPPVSIVQLIFLQMVGQGPGVGTNLVFLNPHKSHINKKRDYRYRENYVTP